MQTFHSKLNAALLGALLLAMSSCKKNDAVTPSTKDTVYISSKDTIVLEESGTLLGYNTLSGTLEGKRSDSTDYSYPVSYKDPFYLEEIEQKFLYDGRSGYNYQAVFRDGKYTSFWFLFKGIDRNNVKLDDIKVAYMAIYYKKIISPTFYHLLNYNVPSDEITLSDLAFNTTTRVLSGKIKVMKGGEEAGGNLNIGTSTVAFEGDLTLYVPAHSELGRRER